jgi:hypothetical protein
MNEKMEKIEIYPSNNNLKRNNGNLNRIKILIVNFVLSYTNILLRFIHI